MKLHHIVPAVPVEIPHREARDFTIHRVDLIHGDKARQIGSSWQDTDIGRITIDHGSVRFAIAGKIGHNRFPGTASSGKFP